MTLEGMLCVIDASERSRKFPRDNMTSIAGRTLLDFTIENARRVGFDPKDMIVMTSDEETMQWCRRKGLRCLIADLDAPEDGAAELDGTHPAGRLTISPYFQVLDAEAIGHAIRKTNGELRLVFVPKRQGGFIDQDIERTRPIAVFTPSPVGIESRTGVSAYVPVESRVQIEERRDIWSMERLLARKRIAINVEAFREIGMGHIYRQISLADELSAHEVIFVTSDRSEVVARMLTEYGFPFRVCPAGNTEDVLIGLKPDLIVNDVLDTSADFIEHLKERSRVVNFEDLGEGARLADLTINDLYDTPQYESANTRWGHEYVFLRDEFINALPRQFNERVESLLITFGGTDPSDLTKTVLERVSGYCIERGIHIFLVAGAGYWNHDGLEAFLGSLPEGSVDYVKKTGVMSSIMERADLAICSNGRTSYELAYMRIPSIVICHHPREATHAFASEQNGFINLGVYGGENTLARVDRDLRRLVEDPEYRALMKGRMSRFDFFKNKKKVAAMILDLIREER
jgi:spore coat polysaccharide biosynthesis predicted glycosyltransferase SpsG